MYENKYRLQRRTIFLRMHIFLGSAGVLTCWQHPGTGLAPEIHRRVVR